MSQKKSIVGSKVVNPGKNYSIVQPHAVLQRVDIIMTFN